MIWKTKKDLRGEAVPAPGPVKVSASFFADKFSKVYTWSHDLNFRVSYLSDCLTD